MKDNKDTTETTITAVAAPITPTQSAALRVAPQSLDVSVLKLLTSTKSYASAENDGLKLSQKDRITRALAFLQRIKEIMDRTEGNATEANVTSAQESMRQAAVANDGAAESFIDLANMLSFVEDQLIFLAHDFFSDKDRLIGAIATQLGIERSIENDPALLLDPKIAGMVNRQNGPVPKHLS